MIDLATAKAHLRVDTADEDALITVYLGAAQRAVEDATGKLLTPQAVSQTLDGFPPAPCNGNGGWGYGGHSAGYYAGAHLGPRGGELAIRLWKGPVDGATAAVAIAYDDATGVEQALTDFRLVEGSYAKLLPAFGASWPVTAVGPGTVRLSYTAGYGDGDVPPALDQAVLFLTAHFYANREAVNSDVRAAAVELPLAVDMLLAPYASPALA